MPRHPDRCTARLPKWTVGRSQGPAEDRSAMGDPIAQQMKSRNSLLHISTTPGRRCGNACRSDGVHKVSWYCLLNRYRQNPIEFGDDPPWGLRSSQATARKHYVVPTAIIRLPLPVEPAAAPTSGLMPIRELVVQGVAKYHLQTSQISKGAAEAVAFQSYRRKASDNVSWDVREYELNRSADNLICSLAMCAAPDGSTRALLGVLMPSSVLTRRRLPTVRGDWCILRYEDPG